MDHAADRLLALSRARAALRAAGVETAEQFLAMSHPMYVTVEQHFGLVSRIVQSGNLDANAALWTSIPWRVVALHEGLSMRLLYVGAGSEPIAAYSDELGMRRCWQALMQRVGPDLVVRPDGKRSHRRQP